MDEDFFQACLIGEHRVMDVKLKAFSLMHRLILTAIESPVVMRGHVGFLDLCIAVKICGAEHPLLLSFRPSWRDKILYAQHRLRLRWYGKDPHFARELAAFQAYLSDHTCAPNLMESLDETEGETSGIPWILSVVAVLTRSGGLTFSEAWRMSEGKVLWLYATHMRLEGAPIKIYSQTEEASALAELEALEASRQPHTPHE